MKIVMQGSSVHRISRKNNPAEFKKAVFEFMENKNEDKVYRFKYKNRNFQLWKVEETIVVQ